MKNIFSYFFQNVQRIGIVLLFLITAGIIVTILPHETKYRYEYNKGRPWLHETLISPFDFPVYKTDKEISRETDSINSNTPYYFQFNKLTGDKNIRLFKNNYYLLWDSLGVADSVYSLNTELKETVFSFCSSMLDNFYNNPGIIEIPDSLVFLLNQPKSIYVIKDKAEEEYLANLFLTKQDALARLNAETGNFISNNLVNKDILTHIIKEIYLDQYIEPNIFIDKETTTLTREQIIENISLTQGMIQAGEKIISTGEIVNNEKFNILESLRKEYEQSSNNPALIAGQSLSVLVGLMMIFLFLLHFRRDILEHLLKTMFILSLIVLFVSVARVMISWNVISIYLVPFTLLPIIIRAFYDSRLSLFIYNITILIIGFIVPNSFEFVYLQMIAGMTAIFALANVRRRGQLFLTAVFIFLTYSVLYLGIAVVQEGGLPNIRWKNFAWFAGNGLMVLAAYPLIYIFEKLFGFLSDVTLMELADTNQKLLRMLAEKAPGTFQHSLQVANLAEEVIIKIGGNSLLIRTGALYHDIGKIGLPHFFIENQGFGKNPHDELDIEKSAEIITGHVQYGVEMAHKHRLPEPVIDFIRTHHGNTKVQYFYKTFLKKYPQSEIDIHKFSYNGKPPFSKETAILMMADSIEASARSLKYLTDQSINELVENIVQYQMSEKQFDNAAITLKEISEAKEIFKRKLKNIYHTRIEYPA